MKAKALVLALSASSVACGAGHGGECRSRSDCDAPEECAPPERDHAVCGMPCSVTNDCPEQGCPQGQACIEYLGDCCDFGADLSSRCVPACPTTPCADGETCAPDGRCVADSCTEGYACREHFVCNDANPGADFHGCIRASCGGDSECEGGACVEGRCFDSPGTCGEPQIVP